MYPSLTAREYVRYAATLAGVTDVDEATARAIETVALGEPADRKLAGYSKGMRQRAKVAAALVSDPQILLLDEPLNGTDPVQRLHLINLFQRLGAEGRTVIVSSHILDEVDRMSDRVIAIVDGRLAAAGDVAAIREAMTDIPYRVRIESDSDPGARGPASRRGVRTRRIRRRWDPARRNRRPRVARTSGSGRRREKSMRALPPSNPRMPRSRVSSAIW